VILRSTAAPRGPERTQKTQPDLLTADLSVVDARRAESSSTGRDGMLIENSAVGVEREPPAPDDEQLDSQPLAQGPSIRVRVGCAMRSCSAAAVDVLGPRVDEPLIVAVAHAFTFTYVVTASKRL